MWGRGPLDTGCGLSRFLVASRFALAGEGFGSREEALQWLPESSVVGDAPPEGRGGCARSLLLTGARRPPEFRSVFPAVIGSVSPARTSLITCL